MVSIIRRFTDEILIAFLVGILTHSVSPYAVLPLKLISLAVVATVAFYYLSNFFSKYALVHFYIKVVCIVSSGFIFGLLYFSWRQFELPRGLIFANPKGLALSSPSTHTANLFDPRFWLTRLHTTLNQRAAERFSPDEAALLTGILYGERNLSKPAKTNFRHAGLTHIIAVSGSNMTIVVVLAVRAFMFLRCSRRQAFICTLIAISAFVLFVGASASVVRAAMMGVFLELAPIMGRLVHPSRLLLLSACFFTLWHPWTLVFDASFALSFLAMLGLLTWGRWLDAHCKKYIHSSVLREILTSSFGAMLMTTPYSAWAFGNITLWGLPTGLLVLPLVPITMFFGAVSLMIPALSCAKSLVMIVSLPAAGCLEMILRISRVPGDVGYGFSDKVFLPWVWFVGSYGALFCVWQGVSQSKKCKAR